MATTKPERNTPEPSHSKPSLTRREIVTALASGFALAVQPVSAATITTDAENLLVGEVQIPTPDGQIPAYKAQPAKGDKFPTVLVVQEIFGVHEHIKDICRRFATLGYLAVAPELFFRQGDVSKFTDFKDILSKVVSKVPGKQVLQDLDATATWAAKSGGDHSKLAVTGFCWGGRIVWLYAAHNPELKAGVAWYGRLTNPKNELQPARST
jgi:carboxymethylenebutenolidase